MKNTQQQQAFKKMLLELKAMHEQRESNNQDALNTVELDQNKVGRLSRIDALQGQKMAQALERMRLEKIQRIDGALLRIETNDYGFCYVCGEAIQQERLCFDPTITRCVACSEQDENKYI